MKKCPFCAEEIKDEAIKCRYCGEWTNRELENSIHNENNIQVIEDDIYSQNIKAIIKDLECLINKFSQNVKNGSISRDEININLKMIGDKISASQSVIERKPLKQILNNRIKEIEKQLIEEVLHEHNGNVTNSAKELGISRKGLQLKMIQYDLREKK